jgi:hypothetical protein
VVANGIAWPAIGAGSTVTVPDSSAYAVGQGVYVVGYGWLMVSAIPSATQVTLQNNEFRANPAPGTVVPGPVAIAPGIMPTPDVEYSDLQSEIEAEIAQQVGEEVTSQIDPAPEFPTETIQTVESGKIPLWTHGVDADDTMSRLDAQEVRDESEAPLATVKAAGCDGDEVRIDRLNPLESDTGDMLLISRPTECDRTAPIPRRATFEEIEDDVHPTFAPVGFRTQEVVCDGGNIIKRTWQRLKKLVLHGDFLFVPATDDNTLRVIVSNYDGTQHKLAPLTLGDNEVLAGDGNGGVKIRNVLDMVPPSVVAVDSGEAVLMASGTADATGSVTPNSSLTAPDCTTHAILALRLGNDNNTECTMSIGGYQRLKVGSGTSDPNTGDTVVWAPLADPVGSLAYSIASTGDGGPSEWSISLIGYQCNRP